MRWLEGTRPVLGWAIVLASLVVAVVAFNARTVRQYGELSDWGGASTATDGLRSWQGWVLLAVPVTWVVLGIIATTGRRWWLLLAPIAGFAWASVNIGALLQRLEAELASPRTFQTRIPIRPPSGPIVDEQGFPLHYATAVRVYDLQIPDGMELAKVGCLLLTALLTVLVGLHIADAIVRRREHRSAGRIALAD